MARASSPSMVGRSDALAALRGAAARAAVGEPRAVVVEGEAGIGKTRLLQELLTGLSGVRVLRGACAGPAARTLPLGPWVEVLRSLDPSDPSVSSLVRALDAPAVTSGLSSVRLCEAVSRCVLAAASDDRVVLVLEDLHWADPSTLDVVEFLCRSVRHERLLLLVSVRTHDPAYRQVRPLLSELSRVPAVQTVALHRLSPEQVAEQVAGLGGNHGSLTIDDLTRLSDGVPFYVEELASQAACVDEAPAYADRAVGHRLLGLDPSSKLVASLAALAYADAPDAVMLRASGLADEDYGAAVRCLVERDLLHADTRRARYGIRHALLREAVLAGLLPQERTRLHRAWGEAWDQEPPSSDARLPALAHHWCGASDDRAVGTCLEMAERAGRVSAYTEQLRLLDEATRRWPEVPASGRPKGHDLADLHLAAAAASRMIGDAAAGRRHVEAARRTIPSDDRVRTGWMLLREMWVRQAEGQAHQVDDYLDALAMVPAEPPDPRRVEACASVAMRLALVGRYEEARRLATGAARDAEVLGDEAATLERHSTLGSILAMEGRHAQAQRLTELQLHRVSARDDPLTAGDVHSNAGYIAWLAGDLDGSLAHTLTAATLLGGDRPGPMAFEWAAALLNSAETQMDLGRWGEATRHLDTVAAAGSLNPRVDGWRVRLGIHLAAWRGDLDRDGFLDFWSTRRLGDWETLPDLQDVLPHLVTMTDAFACAGDYDRARPPVLRLLRRSEMDVAAPLGYLLPLLATVARYEADRALSDGPDRTGEAIVSRLAELADREPRTLRDAAMQADVRCELMRSEHRDDLEAYAESVRLWSSTRMRRWYGWARVREARALAASDRSTAAAALVSTREIALELGARPLLDAVDAAAVDAHLRLPSLPTTNRPAPLTARENEVLELVAAGATDRQVAEQLFISPKTVGVHVSHILAKLGAVNRTQAADVARREGWVPPQRREPD